MKDLNKIKESVDRMLIEEGYNQDWQFQGGYLMKWEDNIHWSVEVYGSISAKSLTKLYDEVGDFQIREGRDCKVLYWIIK